MMGRCYSLRRLFTSTHSSAVQGLSDLNQNLGTLVVKNARHGDMSLGANQYRQLACERDQRTGQDNV